MIFRVSVGGVALVMALSALVGVVLFKNAPVDSLRRADAVIVLGGEHDGREDYGLQLVRDGFADVLLLSDPYPPGDPTMRRLCSAQADAIEIVCQRPMPPTTRGEAAMARRLAAERNWRTVIVVSWQYHLPRVRMIFEQCFSTQPAAAIMVAVPRSYEFSVGQWEYTYLYQFAGFAKAFIQGRCG